MHHIHHGDEDAIEAALASDGGGAVLDDEGHVQQSMSDDGGESGSSAELDALLPGSKRKRGRGRAGVGGGGGGWMDGFLRALGGSGASDKHRDDRKKGLLLPEGVEGVFDNVQGIKLQGGESESVS